MLRAGGLKLNKLELVGMNLGAHILSFAGKNFKKITDKRLPVLVALEPSGPCFAEAQKTERLDKDDADFVMVLHTNGEDLGMLYPSGQVDIYVNGGKKQPAEEGRFRCGVVCSHLKVLNYWSVAVANPTGLQIQINLSNFTFAYYSCVSCFFSYRDVRADRDCTYQP